MNMKKTGLSVAFLFFVTITAIAQDKIYTKAGSISFYSKSSLENIEAHNKKATCIVDKTTGQMEFAVLMKAFEFEKALMEEHFNENYVESDKYPKSTFKGKITNLSAINFAKDGTYDAAVSGDITIHGVTKQVSSKGKFIVSGGKITASSEFNILLSDFNISIPSAVKNNISNDIKITVDLILDALVQ